MTAPPVDCACVFHSNGYEWNYVEHLHQNLQRNISRPLRFHVFTEESRQVPHGMIKHNLYEWDGISGPKKSWWYKMQMFNDQHIQSPVLYLDLDVMITGNLDWIWDLDTNYFWTIRDFKYLWRPNHRGLNSSLMFWDTKNFSHIWRDFSKREISQVVREFRGDQDYLTSILKDDERRFLPEGICKSYRWQIKDGGMDMRTHTYRFPESGAKIPPDTKVVVFHGHPKPHEIEDTLVRRHWASSMHK